MKLKVLWLLASVALAARSDHRIGRNKDAKEANKKSGSLTDVKEKINEFKAKDIAVESEKRFKNVGGNSRHDKRKNKELIDDKTIVDTLTVEDSLTLSEDQIQAAWEQSMRGFEPDDLSTFVVETRDQTSFFEMINHEIPTEIKGNYFSSSNEEKIDFIVQDPDGQVVFKRTGETEGIMIFTTTVPGEYMFTFSNEGDGVYSKTITFALHTYQTIADPVKLDILDGEILTRQDSGIPVGEDGATMDDLMDVLAATKKAVQMSGQMLTEIKMSLERQHGHNKDVIENDQHHYMALAAETLLFVLILAWMQNNIKVSLDGRLIL